MYSVRVLHGVVMCGGNGKTKVVHGLPADGRTLRDGRYLTHCCRVYITITYYSMHMCDSARQKQRYYDGYATSPCWSRSETKSTCSYDTPFSIIVADSMNLRDCDDGKPMRASTADFSRVQFKGLIKFPLFSIH